MMNFTQKADSPAQSIFISILIAGFFFLNRPAAAQLSPGDLHQTHADLEGLSNCTKCHESGQKLSPAKCLECHTILKRKIEAGNGLHARTDYSDCAACHVEHQGRESTLIYWPNGPDKFDHLLTGYALEGKHLGLECRRCHRPAHIPDKKSLTDRPIDPQKTFLGLSRDCLSCHRDEHRGQLKKECLSCHTMDGWKNLPGFDHRNTRFTLTGRHQTVECQKCHKTITDNTDSKDRDYLEFSALDFSSCVSCHPDVHENRFGQNCLGCHSTTGWTSVPESAFNHDQTRYPLRGKHAAVNCQRCHPPGKPLKIARYETCRDCHSDYHRGLFDARNQKGACEECHSVQGFSPSLFTIAGHAKTKFTLTGGHLAVPCIFCHKKIKVGASDQTTQFRFQSQRCASCHNDPHQGEVDRFLKTVSAQTKADGCEHCHVSDSWRTVFFDHNQSVFKLEGKHAATACAKCHLLQTAKKLSFKIGQKPCIECHQDIHQGQFALSGNKVIDCARCHSPAQWLADNFVHDRDSRFKLEGAHRAVKCDACHKPVAGDLTGLIRYKPLESDCKACHGKNFQESGQK